MKQRQAQTHAGRTHPAYREGYPKGNSKTLIVLPSCHQLKNFDSEELQYVINACPARIQAYLDRATVGQELCCLPKTGYLMRCRRA